MQIKILCSRWQDNFSMPWQPSPLLIMTCIHSVFLMFTHLIFARADWWHALGCITPCYWSNKRTRSRLTYWMQIIYYLHFLSGRDFLVRSVDTIQSAIQTIQFARRVSSKSFGYISLMFFLACTSSYRVYSIFILLGARKVIDWKALSIEIKIRQIKQIRSRTNDQN